MTNSPISLRTALAAAALLPVVLPAAYLLHLKRSVSKRTTTSSGRRSPRSATPDSALPTTTPIPYAPISLPPEVKAGDSEWVLAYERVVSHPVDTSTLSLLPGPAPGDDSSPSELLRRYAQATHVAFSRTPQAYAIRASISEPHLRRSFEEAAIQELAFQPGDIVNGVYKVTYHGRGDDPLSERVELVIEAPESYKGHVPKGLLVGEIQVLDSPATADKGDSSSRQQVVFVNETWMWRRTVEPPTLIEGAVGGWLHAVMAGWLILRGVAGVTR